MPQTLPVRAGITPGPSREDAFAGWRQYTAAGIYIDVDTSLSFDDPVYVASLLGNSWHWATTGGSSIYPTPTRAARDGFRIYVRFFDGRPLDPQFAVDRGWRVSWIAMRMGLLVVE
jgi:hypothetical protein